MAEKSQGDDHSEPVHAVCSLGVFASLGYIAQQ